MEKITYLRLRRNNLLYFFISVIVSFLIIFLICKAMIKEPTLKINGTCEKIKEDNLSCKFICYFNPKCKDFENQVNFRMVVLQFHWAAIYDKRTEISCNEDSVFTIVLPKRNYTFELRAAAYNSEFGTFYTVLEC